LGDIHAGTIHFAENELKAKVQEIKKDPAAFWIGMGDYAEWITPSDPRWDPSQRVVADWVEPDNIATSQERYVVSLLEPIKKKCVGLLYGNHEESIRKHNHNNVQKNICEALGVPNLGYSCFVRFAFSRENSTEQHSVIGHFEHGSGNCVTKGAKLNKLRRSMESFDADLYGYAHMHDVITDSKPYLTLNAVNRIWAADKVGAVTGCWLRTYTQGNTSSYGEQKGYPPGKIGCPVFILDPDKGTLEVKA